MPPLPFYVELLGGVFNGDNETAFGFGRINKPLVTGRLRTFFELGDFGALQLGMSVANGLQPDRLNNLILGWDAKYKFTPDGWQHPAASPSAGELLYQMRKVKTETEVVTEVTDDEGGVTETTEIISRKQTLNRVGWYLYGEVQPFRFGWLSGLSAGFRYDWTEYPINPGHQWAVEPYLTLQAVRVPALPCRLQAHGGQYAGLLHEHGLRQRADQGRVLLPVDLHPGRAPHTSVLRRGRSRMHTFIRAFIALRHRPRRAGRAAPTPPTRSASSRPRPTSRRSPRSVGRRSRRGRRPRPRQPEPPRPRGAPEPHGQGAAGRRPRRQRPRARQLGRRRRPGREQCPRHPRRARPRRRVAGILVLEVPTTRVDRSMGDVHPLGNPHYTLDPGMAPPSPRISSRAWRASRRSTAPSSRGTARSSWPASSQAMARWTKLLEPFRGAKIVRTMPTVAVLPHALRPRPGRDHRGPTRHPADARAT